MGSRRRYSISEMSEALRASKGLVSVAAERLGCSHQTLYNGLKRSDKLRSVLKQQREVRIDVAEAKLDEALERGEAWAVALTLKTLGRRRGYVERREMDSTVQHVNTELRIVEKIVPSPVRAREQAALGAPGTNGNGAISN